MKEDNFQEVKNNIEALLFSYGDWLSISEILNTLNLDSELIVKSSLEDLKKKFEDGFSFHIEENDSGKWRMALKENYEDLVVDLVSGTEIPKDAMKVLGVIAYEQPISKTRLAEILGKSVKKEINYLYRNKFLSYEKKGIGKYFRVTKKFYDYFKIEEGEFRSKANQNIKVFLEDPSIENTNIDAVDESKKDEN